MFQGVILREEQKEKRREKEKKNDTGSPAVYFRDSKIYLGGGRSKNYRSLGESHNSSHKNSHNILFMLLRVQSQPEALNRLLLF